MWWWRKVSLARWSAESGSAVAAASDLTEQDLSLFSVATPEEARRVAVIYAVTRTLTPSGLHYVLIEDAALTGLGLTPTPSPDSALHPFLSERHHEVVQIPSADAEAIAARILSKRAAESVPTTLTKTDARDQARAMCETDTELRSRVGAKWRVLMKVDLNA
jgi:hypothetical protein